MTPWNVAYQAPPSMEFSRQEYWSGFLFPFPGDLLDPGIKLWSPAFQADALTSEPPGSQWCCTGGLSRFPGREACVVVLVGGPGFLLSGVQYSVQQ